MKSLLLLMLATPLMWIGTAHAEVDNMSQNEIEDLIEGPGGQEAPATEVAGGKPYINPINAPAGDFSIRSAGFDDKADAEGDVDHEVGEFGTQDALFESNRASVTPSGADSYVSPFRSVSTSPSSEQKVELRRTPASHGKHKHKMAKHGRKKHNIATAKSHGKRRKHGKSVAKGQSHKKGQHRLAGGKFSSRKSYR